METPHYRAVRSYQAWIANETLEDYSLRYAAKSFRKWSPFVIANTALGGISFLALEAIGGSITLNYGLANALPAILLISLFIFVVSLPITYYSARYNIDMDLLTRGAGFGYIGSTITSLTYVSFTFIFFALEGAILAQAMNIYLGLPLVIGYIVSSVVIIPITFMGITMISRLQLVTQPVWIVLLAMPFVWIFSKQPDLLRAWIGFQIPGEGNHFSYIGFGAATGVLCSLVVQIGEQVDYLRFLPDRSPGNRVSWWATVILGGPGWILIGGLKILLGSFLAVLVINAGLPRSTALEPIHMYIQAYSYVSDNRDVVLALAALFVLISQVKINVTNAYAGSLAWSNFFSRATHYHPGRVVWLVFNVLISLMLMLLGIFEMLDLVLAVYSSVAIAWIGAIFADLAVLKPCRISPPFIEFKRAHLHNVNPVGCGAMALASVVSIACYTGIFGRPLQAYSALLSFAVAFGAAIIIGSLTRGRYYIARRAGVLTTAPAGTVRCEMCEHAYEHDDMAYCTFYERPICSLCCSLDAHCHDTCKTDPSALALAPSIGHIKRPFVTKIAPRMGSRLAKVAGVLFAFAVVTGGTFLLTYRMMALEGNPAALVHASLLWRLYIITLPLLAVGAWWVVLSHESRELAERDLIRSLDQLRQAQAELAESERLAAIGQLTATVSHELRNPLGTLVSSIEILRRSLDAPPPAAQNELDRIQRNVWRCARIIEDLLEFSRRRGLSETPIAIDQWVATHVAEQPGMEAIQLRLDLRAGITLRLDSERLRQALANVLQNAVHAINARLSPGDGELAVSTILDHTDLVLAVADNGCGMSDDVRGRIFEPLFSTKAFGVGLGMPLVKRIIEEHGGSVSVQSMLNQGTIVQMRLPVVGREVHPGAGANV
jgi:signal transduction histidine kinase/purine-cytosine permease-like protein